MRRAITIGLAVVAGALAVAALAWLGWAWYESRLPETYSVMDYAIPDGGGQPTGAEHEGHVHGGTSVADLRGPRGTPQRRFTPPHARRTVHLASGRSVDVLSFNGTQRDRSCTSARASSCEATLRNRDVAGGVSVHWHGVDVPNGEDGVAGVTQDAVPPGGVHVYRFRAEQVGDVLVPRPPGVGGGGATRSLRSARDPTSIGSAGRGRRHRGGGPHAGRDAARQCGRRCGATRGRTGTPVRLRLINTDSTPLTFVVGGTRFRVVAIDGTDLVGPTPLASGTSLELAAGGRYDVAFPMPAAPVKLVVAGTPTGLALSADGKSDPPSPSAGLEFDPAAYGRPAPTPFDASSHFDRVFSLEVGRKPGFFDGHPGLQWTINGGIFPRVPMFMVQRGDLVRMSIRNTSGAVHPMHLHGHHMLVLSRDGVAVSGSPWWSDTLNVHPDESYDVAFRADNPGIWMDHCHNLFHAADGLTMHVAYIGVTTPFETGGTSHNHPE